MPPSSTPPPARQGPVIAQARGLAVAVALALGPLLAGACSPAPLGTISSSGTVVDQRTGSPVAGATVAAGSVTATTGPDGGFALAPAPPSIRVDVTATNYEAETISPGSHLRVALTPIPVRGVVTSVLTGAGLRARAGGVATGADGLVTLYGTGPGATVTVTARLYQDGVATVAPNRTFSIQLLPSLDPAAAVVGIPGYDFRVDAAAAAQPASQLRDDPTLAAVKPVLLAGTVSQGGVAVAGLLVLALKASEGVNRVTTSQLIGDASSYPGGVAPGGSTTEALAGVSVQYSESRQGGADLAWQQAATIFILDGRASARPQLEALATALITANA